MEYYHNAWQYLSHQLIEVQDASWPYRDYGNEWRALLDLGFSREEADQMIKTAWFDNPPPRPDHQMTMRRLASLRSDIDSIEKKCIRELKMSVSEVTSELKRSYVTR